MTLGQIFKQKRQESGRSLEQLAALTKIHIKILTALESDSYSTLPARAFTRGFVVNYAKALKLDSEQILKDHHDFLEQHFQERLDRDQGHQGYVFEGKELEQNRRWMTAGATIAVVFAAATLFIFKPQNHKHKEMHKEFEEETQLNADGDPVEAPIPPPTLKESSATPAAAISAVSSPVSSPVNPLASITPFANATLSSVSPAPAKPKASISPSVTPHASPEPSVAASKSPKPSATPSLSPTPAATATPSASPNASASPSPSATPKQDLLNKGDDLTGKEVKKKITFQSKDDLYIRYQSDDKPANMIILRKGRFLVIKAKSKIFFETTHPESLLYKTKGPYEDLTVSKGEVDEDATLKENSEANLGSKSMPDEPPPPPKH